MRFTVDQVLRVTSKDVCVLIGDDRVWLPLEEIYCEDELDEGMGSIEIEISEDLAIDKGIEAYATEEHYTDRYYS